MRVAEKFEYFLETYRRPDGRRWSGQDLHRVTKGFVTRSYVSVLRKGSVQNPGVDKLEAIAKAMGFPPELWFRDLSEASVGPPTRIGDEQWGIPERMNHLLETLKDERTGQPHTDADIARMSLGELSAEDVEGIRTGDTKNPTVAQIVALAGVFGVSPSYFLAKGEKPPTLDEWRTKVLTDPKSVELAAKSMDLSDNAKDLVMDMIERLGQWDDDAGKSG